MLSKQRDIPLETRSQGQGGGQTTPTRFIQFSIAKRRILLMQGDIVVTLLAVLGALWLWAFKAQEPFTLAFIWARVYWFFILPLLWLALAQANDYYNLRITSRFSSSVIRLAWVSL